MLNIDLSGQRAFVAGVADDRGFGFAIARSLSRAGARVCLGTWPPAFFGFANALERGRLDPALGFPDGGRAQIDKVYPLDGCFETDADIPESVRLHRKYKDYSGYSIADVAASLERDFGERPLDIVVHCIANGPEANRRLLDTSLNGYLAAVTASSYSFVAMVRRFCPLLRSGGNFLCLSFLGGERVVPGYAGGISSAKAALESDCRVLAYEVGREHGFRVNCISAGLLASRAARTLGIDDTVVEAVAQGAPIQKPITAEHVAAAATFLASPLAEGITGTTLHVDRGGHAMGVIMAGPSAPAPRAAARPSVNGEAANGAEVV